MSAFDHLLATLDCLERASGYEGMAVMAAETTASSDGLQTVILRLPLPDGTGVNLDLRSDRLWLIVSDEVVRWAYRG